MASVCIFYQQEIAIIVSKANIIESVWCSDVT